MADDWMHQGASYEAQSAAMDKENETTTGSSEEESLYDNVQLERVDAVEDMDESSRNKKSILIIAGLAVAVIVLIFLSLKIFRHKEKAETDEEKEEVVATDDFIWTPVEIDFYTDEERAELRSWGYTGDEIEKYEDEEVSVEELIEEAHIAQLKVQQDLLKELANPESKEYMKLLNSTWLGLPLMLSDISADVNDYTLYEATDNADYTKVEAHGNQFWLRLTLSNDEILFMSVAPYQYASKKKSGNINVRYTYYVYNEHVYVVDIQEIELP